MKTNRAPVLKNKSVIILSSIQWDWQWHRHHVLTFYLARQARKVIYVENLPKRLPRLRETKRVTRRIRFRKKQSLVGSKYQSLLVQAGNIEIISPLALPAINRVFNWLNRKIWLRRLANLIKIRLGGEHPIIWCYLPIQSALDLIELLQPKLLVYDCVDNYLAEPFAPKDIAQTESSLLRRANLVTVTSDFLYQAKSRIRKDVIQILPGVNYELFRRADTGMIQGPIKRVCYFGGMSSIRINFDIIRAIAREGFEVWLIGPVQGKLPALPENVKFLGMVEHKIIPEYLDNCDCLILPYKINEYTKGIIPAKFFECFATGKPIIVTPLPNFQPYKNLLVIADSPQQFVSTLKHIREIENEEKYHQRIKIAQDHSEEHQFDPLLEIIRKKLKDKNRKQ